MNTIKLPKLWLNLLLWSIILSVLWLFFYQYQGELKSALGHISLATFLIVLTLQIPLLALGGYPFKLFCLPYQINLKAVDWIGLTYISNSLNHLLPYRPGLGVRYLYLKKHYQIPNIQFIFVSLIYVLALLFINISFVLSSWIFGDIPDLFFADIQYLASIFLFLILGYLGVKWLKRKAASTPSKKTLPRKSQMIEALSLLIKSPMVLVKSLGVLIVVNLIIAWAFYILFMNLNQPLPFAHCCFLVGFTQLSLLFPITPGNIGISEFIIGSLTQQMYGDFSTGMAAILIFRICQIMVSVPLGMMFGVKMLKK